jgi:murein L,D-transpeptidase YafK
MFKKIFAISFSIILAGCNTTVDSRRGFAPQSESLIKATISVGAMPSSPVLIRIFKQSHELELWRMIDDGSYALVKTYSICAFSGDIGPKNKKGDRQAPEGFYSIGPSQLNYNSIRFLSLNTGYPNIFDRQHGYTGSDLMIHGGCDSAGCYAIEDVPAQEVFTAVRDALKAKQHAVQLQIYPFRMNTWNMYLNSVNKHIAFWRQLKIGYDKFELTNRELNVNVINKKYVIK